MEPAEWEEYSGLGARPSSRRWRTPNSSAPEGPKLRLLSWAAPRGKLKKERGRDPCEGTRHQRSPERALPGALVACGGSPGLGPTSALVPGAGQQREPVRAQPCGRAPSRRHHPIQIGRSRRPLPPRVRWRAEGPLGGYWRSGRGLGARGPCAPAAAGAEVMAARAAGGPSAPPSSKLGGGGLETTGAGTCAALSPGAGLRDTPKWRPDGAPRPLSRWTRASSDGADLRAGPGIWGAPLAEEGTGGPGGVRWGADTGSPLQSGKAWSGPPWERGSCPEAAILPEGPRAGGRLGLPDSA
ncbi:hypothetical protein NDU88_003438 [Pleurodeles waltl]|uniref:Uncharacterized protein n=1 Tax=Pleurodeles waltl TaxID=8319 RepID=A0AAV7RIH9_PLEWA|nr:hypothetical protein NDU88_003438 [Pleurodeles waltl]